NAEHVDWQLHRARRLHEADDSRGSGLVVAHEMHIVRRLDRDPTGVERYPLTDYGQSPRTLAPAVVAHHTHSRGLGAPLIHRQDAARTHLLELGFSKDQRGEPVGAG